MFLTSSTKITSFRFQDSSFFSIVSSLNEVLLLLLLLLLLCRGFERFGNGLHPGSEHVEEAGDGGGGISRRSVDEAFDKLGLGGCCSFSNWSLLLGTEVLVEAKDDNVLVLRLNSFAFIILKEQLSVIFQAEVINCPTLGTPPAVVNPMAPE